MHEHWVGAESVVHVIKGLWGVGNGKFAFLKGLFPLLSIQDRFDDAF